MVKGHEFMPLKPDGLGSYWDGNPEHPHLKPDEEYWCPKCKTTMGVRSIRLMTDEELEELANAAPYEWPEV